MQKIIGVTSIFVLCFVTIVIWVLGKEVIPVIWLTPQRSIAEITGLIGTILISLSFLFATRMKWIENLFGGLDVVYRVHHIMGGLGFSFILYHPVFLVMGVIPNFTLALSYVFISSNISYDLGILSLYSFIILLMLTFFIRLPYSTWKKTHEWMGIPLLIGGIHVLLVQSDTSLNLVLKLWIMGFIIMGLISFFYVRFLYALLPVKYAYVIDQIAMAADKTFKIVLKPEIRKMIHNPGQFIYLEIKDLLWSEGERHPFSIASYAEDHITIGVKVSGDYTTKLEEVKAGQKVNIYGPYGKFGEKLIVKDADEIWIGAGIGITPFLSMLEYKRIHKPQLQVSLFYCFSSPEDAVYDNELQTLTTQAQNVTYIPFCSKEKGHITAGAVGYICKSLSDKYIFLCGPNKMMEGIIEQFIDLGVKPDHIIFEDFNVL